MALQTRAPRTRSIDFNFTFDIHRTLNTIGLMLLVLKIVGLGAIGWGTVLGPFVLAWLWKTAFRIWRARYMAKHPVAPRRQVTKDVEAIGWSVAMGLLPSYGHDNDQEAVQEAREFLATEWNRAMEFTLGQTDILVTAVLSDATAIYPASLGCPRGGESVVVLSGSSNPTKITADQFGAYIEAVEATVQLVRKTMRQNSVRIEFTAIGRSTYFRADGKY